MKCLLPSCQTVKLGFSKLPKKGVEDMETSGSFVADGVRYLAPKKG